MNWRDKINSVLKPYLEKIVAISAREHAAYERAPDPGNAQLWVAVALLSKKVSDLGSQLQHLEETVLQKKSSQKNIRLKYKQ